MTDRELMQQALDALEGYARNCRCEGGGGLCDAGKALKARLAQPEPEPVAWGVLDDDGQIDWTADYAFSNEPGWPDSVPLYTTPPQREWQGLTDEEETELIQRWAGELVFEVTQALKEKNT